MHTIAADDPMRLLHYCLGTRCSG